jgi:hypothetical protein
VEAFQAWMVETRSASIALNKYKCLQQFFRWLRDDEQAIDRNPLQRVQPPKTPTKLVPVLGEADTAKVLAACRGKGFVSLRDEALVPVVCQHRCPAVGGGHAATRRCGGRRWSFQTDCHRHPAQPRLHRTVAFRDVRVADAQTARPGRHHCANTNPTPNSGNHQSTAEVPKIMKDLG